ncbi:zinc finger protein jing-like isoform X2 [Macrobrachium rosenbergii]|uniref:zinc finger protein jing-like isoform X2 n=1 Tax=Macrobrachium rosenbergii TaxID=79674 RepID=UPI0034D56CA6
MCMAPNDGSGVRVGRKGGHDGDQLMGGCNPAAGGGQEVHTPPHKDRPPDTATADAPPPSSATSLTGRVHTRRSLPEEGGSPGNQHQQLADSHHVHLPHRRRRLIATVGHAQKRSGEDEGPGAGNNPLGGVGGGMERRSKVARGSAPTSPPAVNGVKRLNGCVNGIVNGEVKAAALLDRLAGLPSGDDVMMMGGVEKRGRGQHNNHHHTRNNHHHHHNHNNHRHNNHLHNSLAHSNGLIKEVLQNGVEHLLEKNGLKALNGSVVGRRVNGTTPAAPTAATTPNNNNNTAVASPTGPKAEKRLNGALTRLTPTHAHFLRRGVSGNHTNNKNHLHTNNNIEPPTLLPPTPTTKVITPHSDSSSSPIHNLSHPPSPPISPPSLLTSSSSSSSSSSSPPSPSSSSSSSSSSSTHRATQGLLLLPDPPPQGLTFNCDAGLTPPTPSSTPTPPAAHHNSNSSNHHHPTHNNHHHHHYHHHHHPPPLSPTPARCSAKSSPPPAHSTKSRSSSASSSSGVGSSAPSSAPSSGTSTPTPTTVRFPPPQKKEPADVCRWRDCNLTLDPAASLLEHIQAVHVEGQLEAESFRCLWVGCKVYDKASCSVSWLERHVLTHGGHKPFKCIVDGCGQRFSSQTALGRHVNHHFNSTTTTPSPRPPSQPSPTKLIRKNGRKCRYRKKPWSAARMFDVFDVGVMERVRWRLMCVTEVQNGGIPQAPNNAFTVRPQVLARRASPKGSTEVLVKWCPSGVLPDEWMPIDQLEPSKVIPLEKLSPEAKQTVAQLCYPTKPPPQKHRRKRPACPKSVNLLEGSKEV